MKRRKFIKHSGNLSLGFVGLQSLMSTFDSFGGQSALSNKISEEVKAVGYGKLRKDPAGILNLPDGFTYRIISTRGDKMSDGLLVPGLGDGMATFKGTGDNVIIIRNHEVSPGDLENSAFGKPPYLINNVKKSKFYDFGGGQSPCIGGTSTIVYNTKSKTIVTQYLSLVGTIRNCAGGPTPWKSWISCEENTNNASKILEQDHGYNFEVPAREDIHLVDPVPIKAMGRFNHEAICVDPRTSIVYQTEDRHDGLIYRYIPFTPEKLHDGGKLQVLVIKDWKSFDTRNWPTSKNRMSSNKKYQVEWMDIYDVESPEDDLRYKGFDNGAAVFARGEGMWFGDNEVYFACTNGGREMIGQIFRYTPSVHEGTEKEASAPGILELFIEPNNSNLLESCDNMTIGSNGHLVLCEDHERPRIVGVTPEGKTYHIAKNVGFKSEFAGATFSPDGKVLFVNIQKPGITLAIEGPWASV